MIHKKRTQEISYNPVSIVYKNSPDVFYRRWTSMDVLESKIWSRFIAFDTWFPPSSYPICKNRIMFEKLSDWKKEKG